MTFKKSEFLKAYENIGHENLYPVFAVVNEILDLTNCPNLELQKLLFFVYGYYLSKDRKEIFDNDFLAWQDCPVIFPVYQEFRNNGEREIHTDANIFVEEDNHFTQEAIISEIFQEERNTIFDIIKYFEKHKPFNFVSLTHEMKSWKDARQIYKMTYKRENLIMDKNQIYYDFNKFNYVDKIDKFIKNKFK